MDSNTHSTDQPAGPPDEVAALGTAVAALAAQDLGGLPEAVRAQRVLELRRLLDRLEGHWLKELAGLDAWGAAGAEAEFQAGSTAGWLGARLRMGPVPPTGPSGPPEPCSVAPSRRPPRP
jgi:hypothetical protein